MSRWLSKKQVISLLSIILLIGVFFVVKPVEASAIGDAVAKVLGWIIYALVYVIGLILMLVMWVLIKVAQFNDFINAEPVVYGWAIVRDLCNMFFILILLVIAFATILRIEQYSFKKMLPTLIIMAVLINFSKTICSILIDFAQVIMLTFVNGFKDLGTGNLTNMLGIDKLMTMSSSTADPGDVNLWSIVGSYMLALLYATIALIVIITMLAVLVMRMIMIWVYVVLSPFAYLLSAVPGGQGYARQWWQEFSKNLIIGPVLAFFIWLSFASLGGVEEPQVVANIKKINENQQSGAEGQLGTVSVGPTAGITEAGSPDHMIKFIISIAMLLGGLMISQQIGGQAGAMAGKGMQKLQKLGSSATKSLGTGLKRATGVERVQMAYKSYKDMKVADRSQRARDDAVRANRAIGKTKETLAKPFNKLQETTSTRLAANFGGQKQKQAEAERLRLETEKQTRTTTVDDEIKKNQDMIKDIDAGYPEANRELQNLNDREAAGDILTNQELARQAELETVIADPERFRDEALAEIDRLKAEKVEIEIQYNSNIETEQEKIDKYSKRQSRAKKIISTGMAASLGVAGAGLALTGIGTPAAFGAVTGSVGALTGLIAKKNLKNAGKDNLRRAANYNSQKIGMQKDTMKFMGKEKLLDTIKNSTNHHEQAAATMIALEKGDVFSSSQEAARYKDQAANRFKGDDRVVSMLDASADKFYPEHSKPISELKLGGPKASAASKQIVSELNQGITKISDLSAEAIDLTIQDIVSGLKDRTFQTQFDAAPDQRKEAMKQSLDREVVRARQDLAAATTPEETKTRDEQLYKAKKKLSYAKGYDLDSFGPSSDPVNKAHKDKYLGEMKDEEVKKTIKSKDTKTQFFNEIKVRLEGSGLNGASSNEEVAKALKGILKNAGLDSVGDPVTKTIISSLRNNIATLTPPARTP
ncbi:MAG TPA: hypothetical protein PKI61_02815 [bacterium]|nr:hypothetical protein [bacterium]HPT29842.1 hypothetical protein [bacterium]